MKLEKYRKSECNKRDTFLRYRSTKGHPKGKQNTSKTKGKKETNFSKVFKCLVWRYNDSSRGCKILIMFLKSTVFIFSSRSTVWNMSLILSKRNQVLTINWYLLQKKANYLKGFVEYNIFITISAGNDSIFKRMRYLGIQVIGWVLKFWTAFFSLYPY